MSTYKKALLFAIAWFVVFGSCLARADVYASGMLGILGSAQSSPVETKFINFGYRDRVKSVPFLVWQGEVGSWNDIAGNGRLSSEYVAAQVGFEAQNVLTARIMTGPSLVTHPDAFLGMPFQFVEDFYLGVKGTNGISIGGKYKHFSDAGITRINLGRDFAGFEIEFNY